MKKKLLISTILSCLIIISLGLAYTYSQETRYKEQTEAFDLLKDVYQTIIYRYYRDISPQEFVNTAIQAVIDKELDPHSYYYKDSNAFANLKIHTEGEYGGLGIKISIQDGWLTVISPMYNTPASKAGIISGDQIRKIDGQSTEGLDQDVLVDILRGKINTEVTITIRRGEEDAFDVRMIREKIVIPSVPYYGMVQGIGYIHMTEFSKKTRDDLAHAISELSKHQPEGIILDLRNNPGGLLQQAVEVVSLFVGPDKMVVSTKSRSPELYNEWKTEDAKIYDGKLAVLVNRGSASASEIVAGALQDYDRCVIIGTNTFGKGSVQNLIPIDNNGRVLKLTTSHYYVPSGRCVHKFSKNLENKGNRVLSQDSVLLKINQSREHISYLNYEDSVFSEKVKQEKYYTHNGRLVTAGNGIRPDFEVSDSILSPVSTYLIGNHAFFKFIIDYRQKHLLQHYSEITPLILDDFITWCLKKNLRYKSATEKQLEQLEAVIKKDRLNLELLDDIDKMRHKIQHEWTELIQQNKQEMVYLIQRQWITQSEGEEALYPLQFQKDSLILKAISVLKNSQDYEKILAGK